MSTLFSRLAMLVIAATLTVGLVGCKEETPESSIDQAINDAGAELEKAGDEAAKDAGKAADEAAKAIDEAM